MSPEHARGDSVDKKADIWAFGCVLFEMLTGRGMFEGRTVSGTLAAVLMRRPEWQWLLPNLHPRIRLLLERCLEKEHKNRYHDIADVRVDKHTKSVRKAYNLRKRKKIFDWINDLTRALIQASAAHSQRQTEAARRLAVETWLQRNGVIIITQNKKVLPIFPEKSAHN